MSNFNGLGSGVSTHTEPQHFHESSRQERTVGMDPSDEKTTRGISRNRRQREMPGRLGGSRSEGFWTEPGGSENTAVSSLSPTKSHSLVLYLRSQIPPPLSPLSQPLFLSNFSL